MRNFYNNLKEWVMGYGLPVMGAARTVESTESPRVLSVNSSLRYAICLAMLLMLGVGNVWAGAGDITFYASVSASPAAGGTVSLSPGTSQTKTSSYKAFKGYQQTSATFRYSATTNSGYTFKGWSTNSADNSGNGNNPMDQTYYGTGNLLGNATSTAPTYYAIFGRVASASLVTLSDRYVEAGWGGEKSVTVSYVHAGTVTAEISGTNKDEFSFSNTSKSHSTTVVSNNTNTEGSTSITVYFNPSASGTRTATLTFSGNGMTSTVTLSGKGVKNPQTITWATGVDYPTAIVEENTLDIAGYASSNIFDSGIYYETANSSAISIEGTVLTALKDQAGETVVITAKHDGNYKYAAASATKTFSVTNKLRPEFVLYINDVAQESTSANLKVGDVVEIRCTNVPNLQTSGGSATTFTYSVPNSGSNRTVTVTATGAATGATLTLEQGGTTTIAKRNVTFTFNISKYTTELSSLLDVNNFYVGNTVYAATAYNFANGAAYNTNNTEVAVDFSSTDENVIKIVDGQIKALKAGSATVTISQTANNKWTGASVEQTITVKKRPAVFTWNVSSSYNWNKTISNPFSSNNADTEITCVSDDTQVADYVDGKVIIYNVSGTVKFTLTQAENDVWAKTSKEYTVTVSKTNKHVEFTLNESLYNALKDDSKSSGERAWDGGIRVGKASDGFNWDDKYVVIGPFEGVPDSIFCNYSCSDAATGRDWRIYESSNGSDWGTHVCKSTSAGSFSEALKPSTRYFKFYWTGNCAAYFSNIKVTERREVVPAADTVDCGTANYGSDPTEVKPIVKWYNVKPLTCSLSGANPEAFDLVTTSINSKLDTHKVNQEVTIRGRHDVTPGKYEAVVNVTNGTESTSFVVKTETTRQTPVITWKDNLSPLSVGDVVSDAASAGSATVKYTVDGTYLTLNEDGAIVAENATDAEGVDLIAYVEQDNTWEAVSETIKVVVTNLQKQTITWNDKLSFKFTGTKVIDLTATSSSGVEITYELSGTGNYATLDNANKKLTVTGIGSSLYLTAKTIDNAEYYPAARTKTINSRDPNASCASEKLYEEYAEQTLTTGVTSFTGEWVELDWSGEHPGAEPGVISFKIKRGTAAAGDMALDEWYDNEWHRVKTYENLSTSYAEKTETHSRKATKVRIGAPTGATLKHFVKDIVLYQAKYCELSKTALDFGTVTMGTAPTMSFTVHYSNLEKSLDIELENANTQFSVDKTYIGDDCGEHETVTVTVTYNAANYVESESTNLVISNTEYTKKVSLKALVQKASQTITWDPASLELKTTDNVTFGATTTESAAETGIVVTYAVKGESDVATVTSDGQLSILKDGQVTIVASAEGNDQYADATDVERTFTISKVTPTITKDPTINSITLPATLADVAIGTDGTAKDDKETAVTGSFTWQNTGTKVMAGANDYAIVFTPNQPAGKDWYNSNTYNISVTGVKDSQTITWTRADETTQPCSTPTTFDASSNRGLTISYSSSDESIARVEKMNEEYHLVVLTSGTVTITASQIGNGDYEAAESKTKRITLTKEQPVIVTPPTAEDIFTDNHLSEAALSGGEGQVNGVHAEGIFAWKYGDIQPEAGTHTYTATFTPSPAAWYYAAECQVSVKVSKHPQSILWNYTGGEIFVNKDDLYFSGAESNAQLPVYYTTSKAEVAEVDASDNNRLVIHGKGVIDVIARSDGNTNYEAAEKRVRLTINPLTVTVNEGPTATGITYGQALSASTLSGGNVEGSDGATLAGAWAWNDGEELLNADDNAQNRNVTFTPTDSHWYATASASASVNVAKAVPTVSATTTLVYGQRLSETNLQNTTTGVFGEPLSGSVAWAGSVDQSIILVIGNQHHVAIRFTSSSSNYTDGDGFCTVTVLEGVVFKGNTDNSWGEENNWLGGTPGSNDRVTVDADVEITAPVTIGGLTINEGANVTVKNGGKLTIGDADSFVRATYGNLTIEAGGEVDLGEGKLKVNDFAIETTMASGKSGQLNGATASNFAAAGEAYIDITLGAAGKRAEQWHAFTVPFPVDALNGIFDAETGDKLVNEVNYAIMDYHGDIRATGKYGWKKYRKTLVPGTFYIMTVDGERTTYRFKKKVGAALIAENSKETFEYAKSGDGQDIDAGWNGIGNPTLQYGKVNVPVQVLDPEAYEYVTKTAGSTNFVVGTPFFYKACADGSIMMQTADAGAYYAPARRTVREIKDVDITFGNEAYKDHLYISASEEALDSYEQDKDLVKMRMSKTPKVAQIMAKAYGCELSMVNAPMVNDEARYALSLYAPAAGEYTISCDAMALDEDGSQLYLTYNGYPIWNLSSSPMTVMLPKGNSTQFGLKIVRSNAMPTGIEEVTGYGLRVTGAEKMIMDGKLFILRDGVLYDGTGRRVR